MLLRPGGCAGEEFMRLRFVVVLVALGVLVELVSCGSQTGEYLSTFEVVWKKVNETFPDPAFGGVNWREVHDRYQPQIAGVRQDEAFYGLINRMLWELGVSHANLVPPGRLHVTSRSCSPRAARGWISGCSTERLW